MKNKINILLITISLFVFSSCKADSVSYSFDNDMANHPYKQYIESLEYLEENDWKIRAFYRVYDADMVEAASNSLSNWEMELNKIYGLLLDKLSTEDAEKLKIEQHAWEEETGEKVSRLVEGRLVHVENIGSEAEKYAVRADEAEGYYYTTVYYNYWLYKETKERTLELIHKYFDHDRDRDLAMKAYRAVMQNESVFFCINEGNGEKKHEFFNDYFYDKFIERTIPRQFTIVDLDGDNVPEIVVSHLLLHYEDGTVYGYCGGGRLFDIKEDGSLGLDDALRVEGYSKFKFFGVFRDKQILAMFDGKNGYKINDISCTKEEYTAFSETQEQKQDVIWYELNDKNITRMVR